MKRSLFFIRRFLRLLETFYTLTSFIFFAELFFIKNENGGGAICVAAFVICVLSYVVRELMDRGVFIMLIHIAFAVTGFLLPFSLAEGVLLMIICGLMCGGALMYLGRGCTLKPYDEAPWEKIVFTVVIHLMGIYLQSSLLMNISYACTMLIFINYLLVLYADGIEKYMESTKDVTGLPVRSMLTANSYIVGFVLVILTLGMLLGQVIDVSDSVEAIRKLLVSTVKAIFYFFKYLFIMFMFIVGGRNDDELEAGKAALAAAETEAGVLAQVIDALIKLGVTAVVLYFTVKLLIRFVKWLMAKQVRYGDVVESLTKGRLKDKGDRDGGEKRRFGFMRTPEETARRAYKLRVLRHRDTFIPDKTMTCGDIKEIIDGRELDDITELSGLYEQVRYGAKPCDRETAKKMTNLSRM